MTKVLDYLVALAAVAIIVQVFAFEDTGRAIAAAAQQVFVTNTANKPVWTRDVNDARQPIHQSLQLNMFEDDYGEDGELYTVPAGKRLVIEYVSGEGYVPINQGLLKVGLITIVNGIQRPHFVAPTWQGNYGASFFTAGEATRIYADPGTKVVAMFERSSSTSSAYWRASISGYLVNVP